MAGYLVGNGLKLYRRANSLVRSPITKTISIAPDEMAYYPICGEYAGSSNDRAPARGFCSTTNLYTEGDSIQMGKYMRRAYLGLGASVFQGWWMTVNRNPRFVFYQGRYAPTALIASLSCEAFMMIPAYHFTIPSEYNGFGVYGASIGLTHYGTIVGVDRAGNTASDSNSIDYYASEAPTNYLASDSDWRGPWVQRIGVYQSLDSSISRMHNSATDDITLYTNTVKNDLRYVENGTTKSSTGRYAPLIGNGSVTYGDDGIMQTKTPWSQSVQLSETSCNNLGTHRGGWVVISPNVGVSTLSEEDNDNDYPFYHNSDRYNHWLCCSFGDYALQVTLQLG